MDALMVYITFSSMIEAKKIGKILVESRLAACVNIREDVTSIYRWDGKICEGKEVLMIAKTLESRFLELKEKVLSLHTYECPCIVCFPLTDGHRGFIDWVAAEVASVDFP